MVDKVMAQGQQNEEELHGHGGVARYLQDVKGVPWVGDHRRVRVCQGVEARSEEASEDDALDGHKEDLDADEVSVQKRIILAGDGLLELDHDQDLVDVYDAENDLGPHDREVHVVAVVEDHTRRHVRVELCLEALVVRRQDRLHAQVQDQSRVDIHL